MYIIGFVTKVLGDNSSKNSVNYKRITRSKKGLDGIEDDKQIGRPST